MVGLLCGDHWSVSGKREMNTWIWHKIGLEFCQIDVKGAIETKRCGDRRHDLSDQSIEVGVGWSFDVKVTTADIVDGLVVHHETTIRVLQCCVGGQNRVVRFDNRGGDLGGWVD